MTIKRNPTSIVVNGAYLRVKDPTAAAGSLFSDYQAIPGLGSFTLPAEAGNTTETPLMDGVIAAAQFKGVGTVTGAIGARGVHPAHQFLEARANDGKQVQIEIIRLATNVITLSGNVGDAAAAANGVSVITLDQAAAIASAKASILWGHLLQFDDDGSSAVDSVASYLAAAAAANDNAWHIISEISEDGTSIKVAPGYSAALNGAAGTKINVRNPGVRWSDVTCVVNQFDGGDFQGGSNVSGNVTFTPSSAMPNAIVEHRIALP